MSGKTDKPSTRKKVSTKGQLPAIKSTTKLVITVDCRDIYNDKKKSREVSTILTVRDNKLLAKIGRLNMEVGRIDPIRLEEYCIEANVRPENVWSNYHDLYKITFDQQVIDEIFNNKWCLTAEDLSLVYGYLLYSEHKAFYSLCLADFSEIPDIAREDNKEGQDFEYIAVENKDIYPNCLYKIELK